MLKMKAMTPKRSCMLKEFWSTITLKARSEQISGETTEINALQ
jgi:hypothetical protein